MPTAHFGGVYSVIGSHIALAYLLLNPSNVGAAAAAAGLLLPLY